MSLINKGPSIITVDNDGKAISLINRLSGNNYTNIGNALEWASNQDDIFVQKNTTENIITDGLVLYLDASNIESYPKSGNTWYDLSGNGNNGVINGTTGYEGVFQGSFGFNSNNYGIDFSVTQPRMSDWTLITWVYKSDWSLGSSRQDWIAMGVDQDTSSSDKISFLINSGSVGWSRGYASGVTTVYPISNYKGWMCVAKTQSRTSSTNVKIDFYINGKNEHSSDQNWEDADPSVSFMIGYFNNTAPNDVFEGNIANTFLYNRSLSESEIKQNYNALKHRYNMVFAYDIGDTNSYIGEPNGSITPTQSLLDLTGNNTIDLSNVVFDSNGYPIWDGSDMAIVTTFSNPTTTPTSLTIETVFKPSPLSSGWRCAIHRSNTSSVGSPEFWQGINSGGYITGTIGANTGVSGTYNAGSTDVLAVVDTYYHVITTWDGSVVKTYVNGILKKTYSLNSYSNATNPNIRFGANNDNGTAYKFIGYIPISKIYWNTDFSEQEVKYNFDILKDRFGL